MDRIGMRREAHFVQGSYMRDRELPTIDVPAVVKEMAERMPALLDRSHGRRIQHYNT
jgi:hypothetical protein